jgi:hypothetical protein
MKTSNGTDNVVSLDDYRKTKQVKTQDSVKQVFKDSMDNDQVMRRYNIEERYKNFKERIDRINKLLGELNNKCST